MAIILFCNLKGGVAKTTTAVALAECLASRGERTLMIDADHQCMAGELLLGESRQLSADRSKKTLHDLLAAMLDDRFDAAKQLDWYISRSASDIGGGLPNLSVLPCSLRIDDFNTNMAKARKGHNSNDEFLGMLNRRRSQLRAWLNSNFQHVLIDCPPSIAIQVRFLLAIADGYVVPSVPDRLSVRGSLYLLDRIASKGYRLPALGTAWTLYRDQNRGHRRTIAAAREQISPFDLLPKPFEAIIPNAAAISEATEPGKKPASFRAKYGSPFGLLFEQLCEEVVSRVNKELRKDSKPEPVMEPAEPVSEILDSVT